MGETDSMVAGLGLNAAVAEEVMGWQPHPNGRTGSFLSKSAQIYGWSPSAYWSAAGEVVERMKTLGWPWVCLGTNPDGSYWVSFGGPGREPTNIHDGMGATIPLAICLAALAAVRGAK